MSVCAMQHNVMSNMLRGSWGLSMPMLVVSSVH